jgi:hypothetical protein
MCSIRTLHVLQRTSLQPTRLQSVVHHCQHHRCACCFLPGLSEPMPPVLQLFHYFTGHALNSYSQSHTTCSKHDSH